MTDNEIEQVIDYVMFLSMRGETELGLIEVAAGADNADPNALSADVVKEVADQVFTKWKLAQTQIVEPGGRAAHRPLPRASLAAATCF